MSRSGLDFGNESTLVDYTKTLDCIHCGLCLHTCPTYLLTGNEASSPRGRIHLMRAAAEGRIEADAEFAAEMDFCLLCRHCESACPAGVHFGEMMETTRNALQSEHKPALATRLARWLGFRVLLPHRLALSSAAFLARFAQRTGLAGLTRRVLGARGEFIEAAPELPPQRKRRRLPRRTHAIGEARGEVALLEGCVMPILFGDVNRDTAASIAALGHDVSVPKGVTCCGSLHAHNGDLDGARRLARKLIPAFEVSGAAPIVINSAGCGAHLRELATLFASDDPWHERAAALSSRVLDYTEFMAAELLGSTDASTPPTLRAPDVPQPLTWDAPCHLCHAQQVRTPPLDLLDALPDAERVELENAESCCGSAGIYSLLRPGDSREVLEPKLEALRRSGARTLVTANPGCQLQWQSGVDSAGLDVRVVHIATVIRSSLER